jgi:hypothetical protein
MLRVVCLAYRHTFQCRNVTLPPQDAHCRLHDLRERQARQGHRPSPNPPPQSPAHTSRTRPARRARSFRPVGLAERRQDVPAQSSRRGYAQVALSPQCGAHSQRMLWGANQSPPGRKAGSPGLSPDPACTKGCRLETASKLHTRDHGSRERHRWGRRLAHDTSGRYTDPFPLHALLARAVPYGVQGDTGGGYCLNTDRAVSVKVRLLRLPRRVNWPLGHLSRAERAVRAAVA